MCGFKIERLMNKTDKKYYNQLQELWQSESNLEMVPVIESLYRFQQNNIISKEEFSIAKEFLMIKYDTNKPISLYVDEYVNAIPILREGLKKHIINDCFYHYAVEQTIQMKRDIFLSKLLLARIISPDDYKKGNRSRRISLILQNRQFLISSSPSVIAIELALNYGYKTVESIISTFRETITMEKEQRHIIIHKGFDFLGVVMPRVTIRDENNKKYCYKDFLHKLKTEK